MAGDLQFDAKKIHGRGRDEQARHRRRHDDVAQSPLADQHVVARRDPGFAVDAETGRGVALGIEIDDENPLADGGERRAEIDGGGRLADPALLVRHRQNARARPGVGLANEGRGRVHGLRFSAVANPEDR